MDIRDRMEKERNGLTKKQRMTADYMRTHPDEMAYLTLKEVSRRVGVTEITVLHTCEALGYAGYNEVKNEFRKVLLTSENEKPVDDKERALFEIGNEEMKAAADYWNHIEIRQFLEAADLILKSQEIFLCGQGFSYDLADIVKNRLMDCNLFSVTVNTELNDEVNAALGIMTEESLVVSVSFPEYYEGTDLITKEARAKQARVLAVTDNENAKIVKEADIALTGPMVMVNLLMSAIRLQQGKSTSEVRQSGREKIKK